MVSENEIQRARGVLWQEKTWQIAQITLYSHTVQHQHQSTVSMRYLSVVILWLQNKETNCKHLSLIFYSEHNNVNYDSSKWLWLANNISNYIYIQYYNTEFLYFSPEYSVSLCLSSRCCLELRLVNFKAA